MPVSVRRRFLPALLLLSAAVAVLSCSEAAGPNGEKIVKVEDNDFDPTTQSIAPGEAVMWQWAGSNPHNVTWVEQSGTGNSDTQSSGTYTRNFSTAGSYAYYCTIHGTATTGMRGSVVVQ